MALRGENVGTAYVRILADGSGLDDSIRDEFKDSDDAFDAAGGRGAKRYTQAWDDEMKRKPNQDRLRNSIIDAIAKNDFLNKEFFKSNNWKNFRKGLETRFGEAGSLAGKNLEQSMIEGMTFEGLGNRLNNITREVSNAVKQIQTMETKANKDRITRLNAEFEVLTRSIDDLTAGRRGVNKSGLLRDLGEIRGELLRTGGMTEEWAVNLDHLDERVRRLHPRIAKMTGNIERFASAAGAATGRGSRNNFLNFMGSLTRNIVNLAQVLPRVVGKFLDLGSAFKATFNESILNGSSTFRATINGIGGLVAGLGPAIAVVAAGFAGLLVFIGPVVAIFSMLLGVVTALASTLTFALAGGIAALAGALVPVAFAIAGVAGAFLTMSDAQKKALKADVKPLVNSFKELGREAGKPIFDNLGAQAKRLVPVLDQFRPMFRGIGEAISRVGDYWIKALEGPGFKTFKDTLTAFIPRAVESLGKSFGNVFGGLGGIFNAMATPGGILDRFLGWLEKITGEFARWANSKQGQKDLLQFFEDAGDSVSAVGGFLKGVTKFLAEIFDKGRGTGDDIFTRMKNSFEGFTSYFEAHPDALANWFDSADQAATDIGKVAKAMGDLIDALDTPETRVLGLAIIRAVGYMVNTIVFIIEAGTYPIRVAMASIERVFNNFSIKDIGGKIAGAFAGVGGKIMTFFTGLPGRVQGIMSRLPGFARSAAASLVSAFAGLIGKIMGNIIALPGRVQGTMSRLGPLARTAVSNVVSAFGGIVGKILANIIPLPGRVSGITGRLPGLARTAVSGIVGAFSGIVGKIANHLSGLGGAMTSAGGKMVSAAASIPGRIAAQFAGLAGKIIAAVGTIHLPTPTINMPKISLPKIPGLATGGLVDRASLRLVGEDGPEAVVPLRRPLNQVDPAVRWLSAIAQGKMPPGMATGGVSSGRSVTIAEGAIQVVTPNADSGAVAQALLNRIVAYGY